MRPPERLAERRTQAEKIKEIQERVAAVEQRVSEETGDLLGRLEELEGGVAEMVDAGAPFRQRIVELGERLGRLEALLELRGDAATPPGRG